jgi:hypothetical protein
MTDITDGFSPGDDEKVVSILNKWKGGVLSDQLFTVLARISPQTSAITVVFRQIDNKTEVLLLPRPDDDPVWPSMLNLPGKMFRAADFKREDKTPINGPIERIQKAELLVNFDYPPKFVGPVFQDTKRGYVVALIYLAEVPANLKQPDHWFWADIDSLSHLENYLKTEQSAIDLALETYLKK